MKEKVDVSIVIVNYNTIALTTDCINSLIEYTKSVHYEIILVENGSNQFRTIDHEHWQGKVKLIVSEDNLGFAKGNNLGIVEAIGKYILLVNSDTLLQSDAVSLLYDYLEKNQEVGVVSPRIIYPAGEHQSVAQRFPSVKYKLIELLRIQKFLAPQKAGKLLLGSFFDHRQTIDVDWVWGTFFMFRNDILNQLPNKKLDDTYFMYCEDMQWCMDIKKLGYRIHFCADAEIIHLMGASNGKKDTLMQQNGSMFMQRNYKSWEIKIISQLDKCLHR
jgi:GT2 family glycosyltransferase